ncbi:MAG: hypothetical protein OEO23_12485, partial [Gemmatimonadota bacterium]|nr:hypothetical protein [Gemmatimonadota bacterium]
YALVEVCIALAGLTFHTAFQTGSVLSYDVLFRLFPGLVWTQAVKWTLAGLLVVLPSILMGATFPLMAAALVRREQGGRDRTGRVLAGLYCLNSLGGALAVLVTGFILIPAVGLPGTSAVAAGLNGAAALLALVVWRFLPDSDVADDVAREPSPAARKPHGQGGISGRAVGSPASRLLLFLAFGTALASFAYEVAWMRMLALAMGNATHAFELMLSAFILGLAIGSALMGRWADSVRRPLVLLGVIQCLMGAFAVATVPAWATSFAWVGELVTELPKDDHGYRVFSAARYALALIVMLPATILAGTTLPLITNALLRSAVGEKAIGQTYSANTAGSIAGVALAGLVVLPWIGLRALLGVGAALDFGLGLLLLARARGPRRRAWGVAVGSSAILVLALQVRAWDPAVLTSGLYRTGRGLLETPEVLYYADGRSATIGLHRTVDSLYVLTTNGKPDASLSARWLRAAREVVPPAAITQQDESTQMLTALISGAFGRNAAPGAGGLTAAVIGHGSGISGHFVLADPAFSQVTTIEIEPRVLDASRAYYPANARVFDDARSVVVIGDAKSYFARAGRTFDVILSEPSNPWVSGTASLFTLEFYERVRQHLSSSGVFAQWIQLYETNDDLIVSVLAALHRSFPDFRGYLVGATDLMVVASAEGLLQEPDWGFVESAGLAAELSHLPPFRGHHLAGLQVFSRRELTPLLESWLTPNSDFRPALDLGAERARFKGDNAAGLLGLVVDPFRVAPALGAWPLPRPDPGGVPVANLPPQRQRENAGLAARAVEALGRLSEDSLRGIPRMVHQNMDRLGHPPAAPEAEGWDIWLRDFVSLDAVLSAGTAGDPVPAFYDDVGAALAGTNAPPWTQEVLHFHRGLAAWNWAEAAQAAHHLLDLGNGSTGATGAEEGLWQLPPAFDGYPLERLLDGAWVAGILAADNALA